MDIEVLLRAWDGERVILHYDKPSGAFIIIAIHSTRLGRAGGGTRVKRYPDLAAAIEDAMRLAEGMTYKFAVGGLPRGGGKAVIALPAGFDAGQRRALLRRHGELIQQLGGLFSTGPDVGVSTEDMDIIAETGAPYIFGRSPAAGGSGSSGPITAHGVFAGIKVVCERLYGDGGIAGRRVLVQGAGQVGATLIELLQEAGSEVSFSDVAEGAVRYFRDERGLRFVPAGEVYGTECDIFSPCALGGILNAATIPQLKCAAVAGSANNQLATPEDAERLRERGILYAPDYVVNVGGAMGLIGMESLGWPYEKAEGEVVRNVQLSLRHIFEVAERDGITTEAAARRFADERVRENGRVKSEEL